MSRNFSLLSGRVVDRNIKMAQKFHLLPISITIIFEFSSKGPSSDSGLAQCECKHFTRCLKKTKQKSKEFL